MSDIDPTIVESAARSLISARKSQGGGIEIDLPVLYPDGQGVSVSVARENGSWCVSDQGLSVMYLTSYGVKVRRDLRHRFVQEVSQYGCEFFEGKVYRVCSAEQIPVAAAFVANAARTVGDYAREIRQSTATSFKDAVEQAVSSSRLCDRIRRRRSYRGKSGRQYRVTYVRMDETEERPEAFIEIISQRSAIPGHFMEFADLREEHRQIANEAIYDETSDFRDEDINLMHQVSAEVVSLPEYRRRASY